MRLPESIQEAGIALSSCVCTCLCACLCARGKSDDFGKLKPSTHKRTKNPWNFLGVKQHAGMYRALSKHIPLSGLYRKFVCFVRMCAPRRKEVYLDGSPGKRLVGSADSQHGQLAGSLLLRPPSCQNLFDKMKRSLRNLSKGISRCYSSIRSGTGCARSQETSSLSVRMGASAISPP